MHLLEHDPNKMWNATLKGGEHSGLCSMLSTRHRISTVLVLINSKYNSVWKSNMKNRDYTSVVGWNNIISWL